MKAGLAQMRSTSVLTFGRQAPIAARRVSRASPQPTMRLHQGGPARRPAGGFVLARATSQGDLVVDRRALQSMQATRVKAELALEDLLQGNKRFQEGQLEICQVDKQRFTELQAGQSPPAIVLCCSDSRAPPEMVMDQGLGDIFVVRVAGNILDDNLLGSMLYAIANLGSRLVMVLGHSKCGACTAAQGAFIASKSGEGDVASAGDPVSKLLTRLMEPCAKLASQNGSSDLKQTLGVEAIVEENARHVAEVTLERLQENLAGQGSIVEELVVAAAKYDLDHGSVNVLQKRYVANGKVQVEA